MVTEQDKKYFYYRSFNWQMTFLFTEVEHIIHARHRRKKTDTDIETADTAATESGRNGHAVIDRLFEIIKEDPTNIALMREVKQAERELYAFLNNEPSAPTEEEIYAYWQLYERAYVEELNTQPACYLLMRGFDACHDGDEWIGIYEDVVDLKAAYEKAVQELDAEHQKDRAEFGDKTTSYTMVHEQIQIHSFYDGRWTYDISMETLLENLRSGGDGLGKEDCHDII